jgi:hypothetical protein
MVTERETPWGYLAIPSGIREQADKESPKLNWATLEQELMESCEDPLFEWLTLSNLSMPMGEEPLLDTYCAKAMYRYAFEGIPFFIKENGATGGIAAREATSTMLFYLDSCLKMTELPASCSYSQKSPSPGLHSVINAVAARSRLDHYRLTGTEWELSVHEVALLARMRELSVRNAASPKSKTPIKTTKSYESATVVDTSEANRWLNQRRRYVPTQLPESEQEVNAMIAAIEEWSL